MLPFGLRSAPKIFNAVADALNWRLQVVGSPLIRHYLDDYIIITPPDRVRCRELITILHHECSRLGMPIAAHKCDGPTTCITFLGIEIDTVSGQLRLPRDKLDHLRLLLKEWRQRKHCDRKQLESLIGLLNHACKVVRSARSLLEENDRPTACCPPPPPLKSPNPPEQRIPFRPCLVERVRRGLEQGVISPPP